MSERARSTALGDACAPPEPPGTAQQPMQRAWYVSTYGEIYGPADLQTLARWAAEGRFGCHCWVREVGSTQWVGAESVSELRQVLASWPLPLATFRERLLAQLVDCVIMLLPLLILGASAWGRMSGLAPFSIIFGGGIIALLVVASNDWILVGSRGQSLGKILLGIAVVDRRGACPDWSTAAMRSATKFGGLLVCGLVGLAWLAVEAVAMRTSPYGQTYHDRWCNTYVCRLRSGPLGLRGLGVNPHKIDIDERQLT